MTARIFLAHASEDKPQVREIYTKLEAKGFRPWLDELDILAGQNWQAEIRNAIRDSNIFVACLSRRSVAKHSFVQNEFRSALVLLGEKPPGTIYFIPLKLEECDIPDLQVPSLGIYLRDIQWLEYWKDGGFERLILAIDRSLGRADSDAVTHANDARQQKLQQEISHRVAVLPLLLGDVFTFTQLHTVKGAVHGKSEQHPHFGKLGEFESLFPEFSGISLFGLMWELQRSLPGPEQPRLEPALQSARELPTIFNHLVLLVPVGNEDSKWQLNREVVPTYRHLLDSFANLPWNARSASVPRHQRR